MSESRLPHPVAGETVRPGAAEEVERVRAIDPLAEERARCIEEWPVRRASPLADAVAPLEGGDC